MNLIPPEYTKYITIIIKASTKNVTQIFCSCGFFSFFQHIYVLQET